MRLLLVLGLLLCVVLFLAGLIAPRRSRQLQRRVDRLLRKGERRSGGSHGRVGHWTKRSLKVTRRATDKSADAGRTVRGKLPR
jgi:hypothetical protein